MDTSHSQPPSSPPRPAQPILASTLYTSLLQTYANLLETNSTSTLHTGCAEIDSYLLQGGLERGLGCVVGVSGELNAAQSSEDGTFTEDPTVGVNTGGPPVSALLALNWLVDALIKDEEAKAVVVDISGAFGVDALAAVVRWRLGAGSGDKAVEREKARGALERVDISRVFDVEGLWEVLGEVVRECESAGGTNFHDDDMLLRDIESASQVQQELAQEGEHQAQDGPPVSLEIGDSQEDEDDDLDNITQSLPASLPEEPEGPEDEPALPQSPPNISSPEPSKPKPKHKPTLLLLAPLTPLLTAHLSTHSRPTSHALFASLSNALHSITHTHHLITIILNGVTNPSRKKKKRSSTEGSDGAPSHKYPYDAYGPGPGYSGNGSSSSSRADRPVSVFSGTAMRPALGSIVDSMCDLHLLVTRVPQMRRDAELLYGGHAHEQQEEGELPQVRYAHVIEVVKDECSDLSRFEVDRPGGEQDQDQDRDEDEDIDKDQSLKSGRREQQKQQEQGTYLRTRKRKDRQQRWCAVRILRNERGVAVGLGDASGPSSSGPSRLRHPHEQESILGATGVRNVAKMYGFGRRV